MALRRYFCFELTTTGLVVGWFWLVQAILSIITSILLLSNIDSYITEKNLPDVDLNQARSVLITLLGSDIAVNIIHVLSSAMLIAGTVKGKHLLLIPWLINTGMSILLSTFLIIGTGILFIINQPTVGLGLTVLIIGSISIIFYMYTWLAIYSLYKVLRDPHSEHQRLIQANNNDTDGVRTYTRIL